MTDWIKKNGIIIVANLLMIGALAPYMWTFARYGISTDSDQWDHFGSYIGGIFSGLAFLGVVYQLHTTRLDQEKQDFERTFFMMLEHHNTQINLLMDKKITNNGAKISIVESLYQELINYPEKKDYDLRERAEIGNFRDIYVDINAYFLNLFRILKFIYENKEFNMNNQYSSLLRSYVPKNLLVVLSYHLYYRNKSYDDYIRYINEFSFFEHMDLFVLEAIFISKVTGIKESDCYKLIRFSKLDHPEMLKFQIALIISENKSKENVDLEKMVKITQAKYNKVKPLDIDNSDFVHNILFYSLFTFDKNAFKGNVDYDNLIIVYENYLNILKFEKAHLFLQETKC
ncbi:putative phage abortive infection protein [Actinobacillus equuli subsp. equuli]|uniref:putative phage abortive infection protein n=1 Tax=Actinobacillus equuli TaxID=718 RepID=UPI0024427AE1|nr:putative phage abortive infection protein [Actinobacillus equuli]WGE65361.1 putative phage abortive infection protein [Actinobacillus equuli subsp. equuli]